MCCSMGKGGNIGDTTTVRDRETPYAWDEIRKHSTENDTWIVLEGRVYDVSNFKKRHPGGWQLMEDHAGQDASVGGAYVRSLLYRVSAPVSKRQIYIHVHVYSVLT